MAEAVPPLRKTPRTPDRDPRKGWPGGAAPAPGAAQATPGETALASPGVAAPASSSGPALAWLGGVPPGWLLGAATASHLNFKSLYSFLSSKVMQMRLASASHRLFRVRVASARILTIDVMACRAGARDRARLMKFSVAACALAARNEVGVRQ